MLKLLVSFFVVAGFSGSSYAAAVHRGGAELLNPKAYSIFASGSMFQTTAYLLTDGTEVTIPEGDSYSLMDFDFGLSYGVSSNIEVTGLLRLRQVSSNVNGTELENSGLESVGVLGKYSFAPIGKTRYALGAYYRQTLYTNKDYDIFTPLDADDLILGDSGSEYGVNLYLTHLTSPSVKWDALLGYRSPANNMSGEVVYKLEGMYRFTKLGLLAGVEGISSLKNDQYTEEPFTKPVQATGATRQFNTINREKVAPYLGANYALDSFLVSLKGQTIMAGQSTDKGNLFLLSLEYSSGGVTKESVKINSFKEYIVDGSVLKVSARGNFIKIDQGLSTDVEKGMKFDIYQTDYFGGNVLVATGIAYEVGADWSIIKLAKKYNEIVIKPGFAARGY